MLVKHTKTHSERTVAIDVETAARLTRHRSEAEEAIAGVLTLLGLPFVFSHDGGQTPWRPDYVTGTWRHLCARAGVAGVRVDDLRHMHASYLLDAGVPLHTVSRRLGHEGASTTSDIYGHAIDARDAGPPTSSVPSSVQASIRWRSRRCWLVEPGRIRGVDDGPDGFLDEVDDLADRGCELGAGGHELPRQDG